MRRYIFVISSILGAIFLGCAALLFVGSLPLAPEHTVYRLLGIQKKRIIGFLPYWLFSTASPPYGTQLTNITYFGLALNNDGTIVKLVNPQEEDPGWTTLKGESFQAVQKTVSSNLQSLSLLVHSADEEIISALLEDPEKHAKSLIEDVAPIMKTYGFSELNLDIESFVDASEEARENFTTFVRTVNEEMDTRNLGLLTVEIPVRSLFGSVVIDPIAMGEIADYVVVMAYDYHYSGSYISGPVAPIGGAGEVREIDVTNTIERVIRMIPKHKVILGIPLYGYQWEVLPGLSQQAVIPGSGATASNKRIEALMENCPPCNKRIDPVSLTAVITSPSGEVVTEIHSEDRASLEKKLELVTRYDLGGVALWALGYEGQGMLEPLQAFKRSFRFLW